MRSWIGGLIAACALFTLTAVTGCAGKQAAAPAAGPQKKTVGGELHADAAGGKFTITGNKGTFDIEMGKAPILERNKPIDKSALVKNSLVVVSGFADGKTVRAEKITFIRGPSQAPTKPVATGSAAGG